VHKRVGRSALTYVTRNGGLASESVYPYKGRQGSCQKVVRPLIPIDGHILVPSNSELELRAAMAHQPVVMTVDAHGLPSGATPLVQDAGADAPGSQDAFPY
jgi:hypothetical protein